jgi:hypothetical protein
MPGNLNSQLLCLKRESYIPQLEKFRIFRYMRYNNISVLTKNMINSFSKLKFVKVDIDENPYLCDCRAIEAMNYLKSMKLPSHHDYLKYLKCVNPVQQRDRMFIRVYNTTLITFLK